MTLLKTFQQKCPNFRLICQRLFGADFTPFKRSCPKKSFLLTNLVADGLDDFLTEKTRADGQQTMRTWSNDQRDFRLNILDTCLLMSAPILWSWILNAIHLNELSGSMGTVISGRVKIYRSVYTSEKYKVRVISQIHLSPLLPANCLTWWMIARLWFASLFIKENAYSHRRYWSALPKFIPSKSVYKNSFQIKTRLEGVKNLHFKTFNKTAISYKQVYCLFSFYFIKLS